MEEGMGACNIANLRHPEFVVPTGTLMFGSPAPLPILKIESRCFTHWLPFVSNRFISSCGTYPFLTLIGALKVPSGLLDPGIQSYFGSSADILAASAQAFASSLDMPPLFLQRQLYVVMLGSWQCRAAGMMRANSINASAAAAKKTHTSPKVLVGLANEWGDFARNPGEHTQQTESTQNMCLATRHPLLFPSPSLTHLVFFHAGPAETLGLSLFPRAYIFDPPALSGANLAD
jgi:hypothetical protein